MAVSMALVGASAAQAAAPDWGYSSTAKNADGSLDFSEWTSLGNLSGGTGIGSLSFTRNDLSYTIEVNAPSSDYYVQPLIANVVINDNDDTAWTYSFAHGSASTSWPLYVNDDTAPYYNELRVSPPMYFMKQSDDALSVAVVGIANVSGNDLPEINYSEVLDVTNDGRLIHNVTITNISGEVLPSIGFTQSVDTMLNDDDYIPIISNGTNSVYIDSGEFRLYLEMLKGDLMEAGPWPDYHEREGYVPVNSYSADQTIVDGVDTDVSYSLNRADFQPDTSVTIGYQERLLAPVEIVPQNVSVKYVDNDANGAAVTPVAGTVVDFVGLPGDAVGFTAVNAQAGIPAGYVYVSIDNVATYDTDPAVTQIITVHVKHALANPVNLETTRTITYSGGGDKTPATVVQTQAWVKWTDQITGETVYTSERGYDAVPTPTIDGWSVSPDQVPATSAVARTTTAPANETVTITYTVEFQTGGSIVTSAPQSTGAALALLMLAAGTMVAVGLARKIHHVK